MLWGARRAWHGHLVVEVGRLSREVHMALRWRRGWFWVHRWAAREEGPGHRHGRPATQSAGEGLWRGFLYLLFLCKNLCICIVRLPIV